MAAPTRTVKVRFDGSARGLTKAAKEGERTIDGFRKQAEKSIRQTDLASGLFDALGALPSQLKGAAIVAAVGIGAVMAPALASAIISGVLLAVGGGVLAAGIIGAAKDARVIAAWKRFGDEAGRVFNRFSEPFIAPLIRAADTFTRALRRAEPTIRAIGRTLAPVIDKLSPAFATMFEKALPGIQRAAEASVPLFEALAKHAPGLGESIGKFFENVAKGAPGAVAFFDKFLSFVETILPKLGGFLTWLSNLGTKMDNFANTELSNLKAALDSFKDDTLAGVKSAWVDIGDAVDRNSEKWKEIKDNVAVFIEEAGPAFKALAQLIGASVAAGINALAELGVWISRILVGLGKIDDLYRRLTGKDVLKSVPKLPGSPGGFQGFAKGGVGSGLAMVGERGRELVDLGDRSRVFNHADTERILGGGGDTVIENHIHIGAEVVRVVRTVVKESSRGLKRNVLAGAGAR